MKKDSKAKPKSAAAKRTKPVPFDTPDVAVPQVVPEVPQSGQPAAPPAPKRRASVWPKLAFGAGMILLLGLAVTMAYGQRTLNPVTMATCRLTGQSGQRSSAAVPGLPNMTKLKTQVALTPAAGPNLVPNPSLESTTSGQPTGWLTNVVGHNTAKFSYATAAHSGARALRVDVTDLTDGDSNWYYSEAAAQPGGYYQFTDYYKSNVDSSVLLTIVSRDGSRRYVDLPQAGPAADWTRYLTKFILPPDTAALNVTHQLAHVGYLETDDYSLTQTRVVGFNRGLVSITFDDGFASAYENGFPLLKRYNLTATQYLISGTIGKPDYVTLEQAQAYRAAGFEIGSHSVHHYDMVTQPAATVAREFSQSQHDLAACLGPVVDYAAPFGTYNDTTLRLAMQDYHSYRSTDEGYNSRDNFDPYNLRVQNISAATPLADIRLWLQQAAEHKTWLILVYHKVEANAAEQADSSETYGVSPASFDTQLRAIKDSGLPAVTVAQALAEIYPQVKSRP
jgi:peptidoglycan/xylan/chitin deacetylase (PgdA/CDA1 family)